ncbi:MAG: hypothetical protein R3200_08885 [Xanthomonadales bacterium]|nr:hypothetical protein [Xanthomonadales bacterium]
MSDLEPELEDEVRRLLLEGRTIDAIKRLREATGMSLADAKALAEDPDLRSRHVPTAGPGKGLSARVQGLLRQGQTVDAVKALREERGMGLKDAHDEVQAYLDRHPEIRRLNPRSRAGPMVIAAVFIVAALLAWFLVRG